MWTYIYEYNVHMYVCIFILYMYRHYAMFVHDINIRICACHMSYVFHVLTIDYLRFIIFSCV